MIALPKFLVTTVKPQSQDGDKVVFNSLSKQVGDLPVFLVNVKYKDKASVAGKPFIDGKVDEIKKLTGTEIKKFADDGKGEFSGTLVSQAEFTALLAKEGKEVLFYIHGMGQQTSQMVEATDSMQTNFDKQKPEEVLVVPVDWAADDGESLQARAAGLVGLATVVRYWEDQGNAKLAGSALWELFSGLKKEDWKGKPLNVIAHSMGNRVLRCVGKSAVIVDDDDGASWYEAGLQKDKTLLQVAPEALQSNENLFDNIFFVAADIPESVFEEPDGPNVERAEHALQSGVAALALMTKRMHVLHAKTDEALNKESIIVNKGHARLGEHGPWSSMLLGVGGESTKVWDKINDELEKIDGIEKDANGNVRVHDCTPWNEKASKNGHSYQFAKEAVAYYLEHMVKGM